MGVVDARGQGNRGSRDAGAGAAPGEGQVAAD
jgi:hypothetical protein